MSLPLVLAAGAALRFLVPSLLPDLTDSLAATIEVSTPIDSFRSLQEAFFLLDNDMSVYDGAMVHHPPLFVSVMKLIKDATPASLSPVLFNALYTMLDLGIAYKLTQLNTWYNTHHSRRTGRLLDPLKPALVASFYLFNPLMILNNWSHSTSTFSYFLIIELLVQVLIDANVFRGAIALACAAYLSFNPIYLVVPYLALAYAVLDRRDWAHPIVKGFGVFFASLAMLLLISFVLSPSPDFLYSCYWSVLLFEKITPNLGLWWYIFTEMFEFFTALYKGIFNLYNFVFVVPLALRFFEYADTPKAGDSFLAFFLCVLWINFSKSYPIIGDLGFSLSLLPIFKNTVIPHTKFLFVSMLLLITNLLLSPIFYYCWIVLGNGNSNFFYSMSLAWGVVHILLFLDIIWGRLVFDYVETNEVKDPNQLRLTQI